MHLTVSKRMDLRMDNTNLMVVENTKAISTPSCVICGWDRQTVQVNAAEFAFDIHNACEVCIRNSTTTLCHNHEKLLENGKLTEEEQLLIDRDNERINESVERLYELFEDGCPNCNDGRLTKCDGCGVLHELDWLNHVILCNRCTDEMDIETDICDDCRNS